jgi:hypothetical protein
MRKTENNPNELETARKELKKLDEALNLFLAIGRKIKKAETVWNDNNVKANQHENTTNLAQG